MLKDLNTNLTKSNVTFFKNQEIWLLDTVISHTTLNTVIIILVIHT